MFNFLSIFTTYSQYIHDIFTVNIQSIFNIFRFQFNSLVQLAIASENRILKNTGTDEKNSNPQKQGGIEIEGDVKFKEYDR